MLDGARGPPEIFMNGRQPPEIASLLLAENHFRHPYLEYPVLIIDFRVLAVNRAWQRHGPQKTVRIMHPLIHTPCHFVFLLEYSLMANRAFSGRMMWLKGPSDRAFSRFLQVSEWSIHLQRNRWTAPLLWISLCFYKKTG